MANQTAHSPFVGDVLHTQVTELIGLTLRYPANNQQNPIEQCPLLAFARKQGGKVLKTAAIADWLTCFN